MAVADTMLVGDETMIVRVHAADRHEAERLADHIREVIARYGESFSVVVVRVGDDATFYYGPAF